MQILGQNNFYNKYFGPKEKTDNLTQTLVGHENPMFSDLKEDMELVVGKINKR